MPVVIKSFVRMAEDVAERASDADKLQKAADLAARLSVKVQEELGLMRQAWNIIETNKEKLKEGAQRVDSKLVEKVNVPSVEGEESGGQKQEKKDSPYDVWINKARGVQDSWVAMLSELQKQFEIQSKLLVKLKTPEYQLPVALEALIFGKTVEMVKKERQNRLDVLTQKLKDGRKLSKDEREEWLAKTRRELVRATPALLKSIYKKLGVADLAVEALLKSFESAANEEAFSSALIAVCTSKDDDERGLPKIYTDFSDVRTNNKEVLSKFKETLVRIFTAKSSEHAEEKALQLLGGLAQNYSIVGKWVSQRLQADSSGKRSAASRSKELRFAVDSAPVSTETKKETPPEEPNNLAVVTLALLQENLVDPLLDIHKIGTATTALALRLCEDPNYCAALKAVALEWKNREEEKKVLEVAKEKKILPEAEPEAKETKVAQLKQQRQIIRAELASRAGDIDRLLIMFDPQHGLVRKGVTAIVEFADVALDNIASITYEAQALFKVQLALSTKASIASFCQEESPALVESKGTAGNSKEWLAKYLAYFEAAAQTFQGIPATGMKVAFPVKLVEICRALNNQNEEYSKAQEELKEIEDRQSSYEGTEVEIPQDLASTFANREEIQTANLKTYAESFREVAELLKSCEKATVEASEGKIVSEVAKVNENLVNFQNLVGKRIQEMKREQAELAGYSEEKPTEEEELVIAARKLRQKLERLYRLQTKDKRAALAQYEIYQTKGQVPSKDDKDDLVKRYNIGKDLEAELLQTLSVSQEDQFALSITRETPLGEAVVKILISIISEEFPEAHLEEVEKKKEDEPEEVETKELVEDMPRSGSEQLAYIRHYLSTYQIEEPLSRELLSGLSKDSKALEELHNQKVFTAWCEAVEKAVGRESFEKLKRDLKAQLNEKLEGSTVEEASRTEMYDRMLDMARAFLVKNLTKKPLVTELTEEQHNKVLELVGPPTPPKVASRSRAERREVLKALKTVDSSRRIRREALRRAMQVFGQDVSNDGETANVN